MTDNLRHEDCQAVSIGEFAVALFPVVVAKHLRAAPPFAVFEGWDATVLSLKSPRRFSSLPYSLPDCHPEREYSFASRSSRTVEGS